MDSRIRPADVTMLRHAALAGSTEDDHAKAIRLCLEGIVSAAVIAERERCAAAIEEVYARGWGCNTDGMRGLVATMIKAIRGGESHVHDVGAACSVSCPINHPRK